MRAVEEVEVGGGGGGRIGATAWMARRIVRWHQLGGSAYYSGRFRFLVERSNRREPGGGKGRGRGVEIYWSYRMDNYKDYGMITVAW